MSRGSVHRVVKPKAEHLDGCTGKVRYKDGPSAKGAIRVLKQRSTRDRVPGRAYECDYCKGWHITSHE